MSLSLMFQTATPRDDAGNWAAITALGADGRVALDDTTVVAAAELLAGVELSNGEQITTYDFSYEEDGRSFPDAHVNSFGPSLLPADKLAQLRALLAPHAGAAAMLDLLVERGLQLSMSTSDMMSRPMPHLKGVNWIADEVEINLSGGRMHAMLRELRIPLREGSESGEIGFDRFAQAVETHGRFVLQPTSRLEAFIACARRQGATTVYWA